MGRYGAIIPNLDKNSNIPRAKIPLYPEGDFSMISFSYRTEPAF